MYQSTIEQAEERHSGKAILVWLHVLVQNQCLWIISAQNGPDIFFDEVKTIKPFNVNAIRADVHYRSLISATLSITLQHDDVIKWKHFPRYWPFVRGIHRPPVNSPHKGQWRRAVIFSLIRAWTNDWVRNRGASDLRRHGAHYDVTVMFFRIAPLAL